MSRVMVEQLKGQKVYLGLGTLPPSDVWKKLRRFDVKTSVSDLKIDHEAKKVLINRTPLKFTFLL